MTTHPDAVDLLADIGGTNARVTFRSADPADPRRSRVYLRQTADFATLEDLLGDVMAEAQTAPARAIIAVPGPVTGETLTFANLPWRLSPRALKDKLGVGDLRLMNDLEAVALALPHLKSDDVAIWRAGAPVRATQVIVAPGTGLGVGALARTEGRWCAVTSEGGHALAAMPRETPPALRALWTGAPCWEDLLSGNGLVRIYRALSEATATDPSAITALAGEGDAQARAAIGFFSYLLGVCAGDMAIVFDARGGCYIAGGVVPALGDLFDVTRFTAGFADKGSYRAYTETIPLHLITHPYPALVGLAARAAAAPRV